MTGTSDTNPYVGPRSIQFGEALYGRAAEAKELFHLLQARRIVVLHSPSGAGKSSLVQAGLIPLLQQARFDVWRPIRVNLDPRGLEGLPAHINRYTLSAVLSLEEELPAERRRSAAVLAEMTLAQYVASRPRRKGRAEQSVVLLLDQFEEILTADPTAVEQKRAFFEQLGEVLENRLYWALLITREDYLGAFAPYRERLPTGMSNTFRLDLLSLDAARLAAVEPALSAGRTFPAADQLIRDLSTVMVQQPDGKFRAEAGLYVEPVQLQVVCRRLWAAMPPDDRVIDEQDLANFADVSRALGAYYAEAVQQVAGKDLAKERAIREWVGNQLIVGGIRSQVRREPGKSGGLDNRLIDTLRESYLVRAEQRAGASWFELSHDRMVEPVQRDNATWEQDHLHPLQIQSKLWNAQGRPDSLLLGSSALAEALAWANANAALVTATETDFLARARELREAEARLRAKELRSARRQRWLSIILAFVGFFALIAMGVSLVLYGRANEERENARNAAEKAREAERLATDAAELARKAADDAEGARQYAEAQQQLALLETLAAERERKNATEQRQIAIAALEEAKKAQLAQTRSLEETKRQARVAHDTLAMLAVGELAPDAHRSLPFLADVQLPEDARGWTEAAALALLYPAPTWTFGGEELQERGIDRDDALQRLGVWGGQIATISTRGLLLLVNSAAEVTRPQSNMVDREERELPSFLLPSPKGNWVVLGGREPRLVPVGGGDEIALAAPGTSLWSADFDRNEQVLIGSFSDGTTAEWELGPRPKARVGRAPAATAAGGNDSEVVNIWKVQFSPDGSRWLAAKSDGQVVIRDLAGQEVARTPSAEEIERHLSGKTASEVKQAGPHHCRSAGLVDAGFAPIGERVLLIGSDRVQRIWDYREGRCMKPNLGLRVQVALWYADRKHTVYLEEDGEVWFAPLEATAEEQPQRLGVNGTRVAVSPAGFIAIADPKGWITVLKMNGRTVVQTWTLPSPASKLKGMEFGPTGLIALYENGLRRWDLDLIRAPSRLVAPPQEILPLAPSKETTLIAQESMNGLQGLVLYPNEKTRPYNLSTDAALWWQLIGRGGTLTMPYPSDSGPQVHPIDMIWHKNLGYAVLFARADGSVHLLPWWTVDEWAAMIHHEKRCIPAADRMLFYGESSKKAEKVALSCQSGTAP